MNREDLIIEINSLISIAEAGVAKYDERKRTNPYEVNLHAIRRHSELLGQIVAYKEILALIGNSSPL